MPGYGYCSWFRGMVELAMAAFLANLFPSVALNVSDGVSYSHDERLLYWLIHRECV
jgi:hypothetical protein